MYYLFYFSMAIELKMDQSNYFIKTYYFFIQKPWAITGSFYIEVITFIFMLIGEGSNKTVTKNSKEQSIQSEANHVYPNAKSPAFLRGSFFGD